MAPPSLEQCRSILVTEGYSDLVVMAELLESLGIADLVFIQQLGGKANLRAKLEVLLSPSVLASKSAIGVVVDADSSPAATGRSVAETLRSLTGRNVSHGEWSPGQPRVGFYLLPDAHTAGELETLVWRAWSSRPEEADAAECVQAFLGCMEAAGRSAKSRDKALVGAMLSVLWDDDPRLGPAVRGRAVGLNHAAFDGLRAFLSVL